jgi:hypothetical protein
MIQTKRPVDLQDELISLHAVRMTLRSKSATAFDEGLFVAAKKLADDADGYTVKINALLDDYLDQRAEAKEAA